MSIKKQLQKYYAKQGLTGKHLRKALQWDMKAVSAEIKRKSALRPFIATSLMDLHWGSMPKTTHLYWAYRYMG